MREFLNTKTFAVRQSDENGNIAFGNDHADWIEIPEDAETATHSNALHGEHILFWKEVYKKYLGTFDFCFNPKLGGDWFRGGDSLNEYIESKSYQGKIIWQREQPDAAASPNEIAKKEYLLPKDQGYELCLCEEGMTIHKSWIEVPEGAEVAVLFEPAMVSNRSGELFFWKDNGNTHYIYSERSECQRPTGWYSCKGNQITTLDEFLQAWAGQCRIVWKREQPTTSLNNIARTAEDHREHNLSNEINDLCAEFGCPPGMDRFAWLKDQLDISQGRVSLGPLATKARMQQESMELRLALLKDLFQPQPVTYHYAASINTARGTVAYDGVITMPQRITGMEDYLQARAEIAKDGNVAPEQVNIHSLSIIS